MIKRVCLTITLVLLIWTSSWCQQKGSPPVEVKKDKVRSYFDGKLFMDTVLIAWSFPGLAEIIGNNKVKSKIDFSSHQDTLYSDSSDVKWLSELLYCEKQQRLPLVSPQLFFRFVWLRSLNPEMIITMFEKNGKLVIETKLIHNKIYGSVKLPLFKLSEFNRVLTNANFWKLKSAKATFIGNDGSTWLIEGQQGDHYHFVYRVSGPDDLIKVGTWLIKNSSAREQAIY